MRSVRHSALIGLFAVMALAGCSTQPGVAKDDFDIAALLVTASEADSAGGWVVSPDEGPVGGKSGDCTGAPYAWPDLREIAHASQFLDRTDETIAVVVKQVDGDAAANVQALRGALAPCAPASGEVEHGAMINPIGDDSFAYQSAGRDGGGDFTTSNMLVACGDLVLETISVSYSNQLDQAALESVVSPALDRLSAAGGC